MVELAGGGVQSGRVVGTSDRLAAFPDLRPVTPGNLLATIHHALGADPDSVVRDRQGQPCPIADGNVIGELF